MNLKCYKSVILAPTFFLMLTERLKILQQVVLFAPLAAIFVRSSLNRQGVLGKFPRSLE